MKENKFVIIDKLIKENKIDEAQLELSRMGTEFHNNAEYLYLRSKVFYINKFLQLPQISNFLTMQIVSSNIKNSTTILKKGNLSLTGPFINQTIGKQVIVNFQSTDIIISTEKPINISARNIILGN